VVKTVLGNVRFGSKRSASSLSCAAMATRASALSIDAISEIRSISFMTAGWRRLAVGHQPRENSQPRHYRRTVPGGEKPRITKLHGRALPATE